MNFPPLLLGCTLLFWGWQSQLLLFAIPVALIVEIPRWINWRWDLSDKEFNWIADISSVVCIVVSVYLLIQQSVYGLFTLLHWLPMLFFPLLVAQIYSTQASIKLSSLFLSLRNVENQRFDQRVNISYPFIITCLLSASVSHAQGFFMGVLILGAWSLWQVRSPRHSMILWFILFTTAAGLGYVGQLGLRSLQGYVEDVVVNWFEEILWPKHNPLERETALGHIGELKQSGRIILRVISRYPLLLRETTYDTYTYYYDEYGKRKWKWQAKQGTVFNGVFPHLDNLSLWPLDSNFETTKSDRKTVHISTYLRQGNGLLALPQGVYQLADLSALSLQRNSLGVMKVERTTDLTEFTAYFDPSISLDSLPTEQDLTIPSYQRVMITELAGQLKLRDQSPQQAVKTVMQFFNQEFHYTLKLPAPQDENLTPLENFLRYQRVGHCEYFATATALLLRAAGIPTRYASGYALEEFSELENLYVVRKRHAHAWVLAYVQGNWQEIDTTPASWAELEAEQSAWWQPIYDVISWALYQFFQWRNSPASEKSNLWLLWLVLPLMLILVWRLYFRKRITRSTNDITDREHLTRIGADSAFYQIIDYLTKLGYIRLAGETLHTWLHRITIPPVAGIDIFTLLALHQRYRFDPNGVNPDEKVWLATQVTIWLRECQLHENKVIL